MLIDSNTKNIEIKCVEMYNVCVAGTHQLLRIATEVPSTCA